MESKKENEIKKKYDLLVVNNAKDILILNRIIFKWLLSVLVKNISLQLKLRKLELMVGLFSVGFAIKNGFKNQQVLKNLKF